MEYQCDNENLESTAIGLLQHNAYSWKVGKDAFVRAKNMTSSKIMRDASMNEWILSLTEEETHAFVDTLYEVVSASEASNIFEFGADWKKCLQNIAAAAKELDDATKKGLQKTARSFFDILIENIKAEYAARKE